MQADSLEAQITKHESHSLSTRAGTHKHQRTLSRELIQNEGQIAILVFGRNEQILHIEPLIQLHTCCTNVLTV